jgi:hypothetical protein
VQGVARGIVLGAQRLELRLGGAHVRLQALECHGKARYRIRMALAGIRGVLLLRIPEEMLDQLEPALVLAEFGRDFRLRVELLQLDAELDPDVLDAGKVLARLRESRFVSRRRSLYLETPAASSRKMRNSSGLASITREIIPCSMIAYARGPRPVPRKRS